MKASAANKCTESLSKKKRSKLINKTMSSIKIPIEILSIFKNSSKLVLTKHLAPSVDLSRNAPAAFH